MVTTKTRRTPGRHNAQFTYKNNSVQFALPPSPAVTGAGGQTKHRAGHRCSLRHRPQRDTASPATLCGKTQRLCPPSKRRHKGSSFPLLHRLRVLRERNRELLPGLLSGVQPLDQRRVPLTDTSCRIATGERTAACRRRRIHGLKGSCMVSPNRGAESSKQTRDRTL